MLKYVRTLSFSLCFEALLKDRVLLLVKSAEVCVLPSLVLSKPVLPDFVCWTAGLPLNPKP